MDEQDVARIADERIAQAMRMLDHETGFGAVIDRNCRRVAEKLEAEAIPPPQPGPWQDTHEWTGEYRLPKAGEYVVNDMKDKDALQTFDDFPERYGPRHILRPKARKFQVGAIVIPDYPPWPKIVTRYCEDGTVALKALFPTRSSVGEITLPEGHLRLANDMEIWESMQHSARERVVEGIREWAAWKLQQAKDGHEQAD